MACLASGTNRAFSIANHWLHTPPLFTIAPDCCCAPRQSFVAWRACYLVASSPVSSVKQYESCVVRLTLDVLLSCDAIVYSVNHIVLPLGKLKP